MSLLRTGLWFTGSFLVLLALSGCPKQPQLSVTPKSISFGTKSEQVSVVVRNLGGGTLTWTAEEVVRAPEGGGVYNPGDTDWLEVAQTSGSTDNQGTNTIQLSAVREGLAVGAYTDAGLRITPNEGEALVVPISLKVEAPLEVNPATVLVSGTQTSGQFHLINQSSTSIAWAAYCLEDADDLTSIVDLPEGVSLSLDRGTLLAGSTAAITATWTSRPNALSLVIDTDAATDTIEIGSPVVRFAFDGDLSGLEVSPTDELDLFMNAGLQDEQPISTIEIVNVTPSDREWRASMVHVDGSTDAIPVAFSETSGTIEGGETLLLELSVSDPDTIEPGSGFYVLAIESDSRVLRIPVNVQVITLPSIAASRPPQPDVVRPEVVSIDTLNFGQYEVTQEFYVVNTGMLESTLNFRISYEEQGAPGALIASIDPLEADTLRENDVFFHPDTGKYPNVLIDGTRVRVAIDRNNMQKDLELRTITIEALGDDGEPLLGVEPLVLTISVERPPLTMEGAGNRARPPFMSRFVFTVRDSFGKAIDTWDPVEYARLGFSVEENGAAVDMDEASQYVTPPDQVRANVVLMLDFSGSMYNAGVLDEDNPLRPGEALESVRAAALRFIDDLPEGWRLSLMFHHDRQQTDYLMHAFSTDREELKAALTNFSLPETLHGVSPIYDAMLAGIANLAGADADDVLPFDDADLRALVLITDGQDNASLNNATAVDTAADEARVRIFPLVYSGGESVDLGPMLLAASNSGGHFYNAGEADKLPGLLVNDKALALQAGDSATDNAAVNFSVVNESTSSFTWHVSGPNPLPAWIASISAEGQDVTSGNVNVLTQADDTTPVSVALQGPISGTEEEVQLNIVSNNGEGAVIIRVTAGEAGAIASASIELRDEPGLILSDMRKQVMLTYVTPSQSGGSYLIVGSYTDARGQQIRGPWQRDGVFAPGDVDASQVSLVTEGLKSDGATGQAYAEAYLRCDYASRNLHRIRTRFYLAVPQDVIDAASSGVGEEASVAQEILARFADIDLDAALTVSLAEDGLLVEGAWSNSDWRALPSGDGVYDVLTQQDNPLPYGAFGNLLKITLSGDAFDAYVNAFTLSREAEILVGMRVDNDIYVSPAAPGQTSETHYVLYPGGPTFLKTFLSVKAAEKLAGPARTAEELAFPAIDPESELAWDYDGDLLPDFLDPKPDDKALPGNLIVPSPVEIQYSGGVKTVTLSVRNNRLDRFVFNPDESALPDWLGVPLSISPEDGLLLPNETGSITFSIVEDALEDGAGNLISRNYGTVLPVDMGIFGEEPVDITLVVNE